jgi:predicted permease
MPLVLDTIVPVAAVVAVGWLLAGRQRLDLASLASIALLVTSPALLFSILARSEIEVARFVTLAGGALFVVAGTGIVALIWSRLTGLERRGLLLPAMLWNAGNMALPVARLAFGAEGLEAAAVVYVTLATLQSSLGIWIAKGEGGLGEALRLPLLHASLLGLLCAATGVVLPRMVMEPIEMLGAMAIPLMLLTLGAQLRGLEIAALSPAIAAVVIRIGGGLCFGLFFVEIFGVEGVTRKVLLLDAIMPAAVINAVISQRYDASPAVVASAIALGTLVSVVTIPALLLFLT